VKFGCDTNLVVRFIVGEPAHQALTVRRLMERMESVGETLYVSDLVVSEAFHVLNSHYEIPAKEALTELAAFLEDPAITGDVARNVLLDITRAAAPPGFMDQLILAHHRDHRTTLLTFDRTLGALPGTELLDGA
jgi:predicted nucleic acid-binding protein